LRCYQKLQLYSTIYLVSRHILLYNHKIISILSLNNFFYKFYFVVMSRAPPSAPVCVVCGEEAKRSLDFIQKFKQTKNWTRLERFRFSFLLCICAVLLNDMLVIANPFFVNNLKQLSNNKTTQSCLK
jgi:hypothetical protein